MMMRRQARQWALMVLYGMDFSGATADEGLKAFFDSFAHGNPIDPEPSWSKVKAYSVADGKQAKSAREFASKLVEGVWRIKSDIDAEIQKTSHHWRMNRMAVIDRNVLRLGAYEISLDSEDVPRKVVINEAVELAKLFGSAESASFVNGILDGLAPVSDVNSVTTL